MIKALKNQGIPEIWIVSIVEMYTNLGSKNYNGQGGAKFSNSDRGKAGRPFVAIYFQQLFGRDI